MRFRSGGRRISECDYNEDLTNFTPSVDYTGTSKEFRKKPLILKIIKWLFLIVLMIALAGGVVIGALALALHINSDKDSSSSAAESQSAMLTVEQTTRLVRVKGEPCSSEELIEVSDLLREYTAILSCQQNYTELNRLCTADSSFAVAEGEHRRKSKYSLDEYDCAARVYRGVASKISVYKINDLIRKEDKLYCYATLTVPDVKALYGYFGKYAYEMTQFLNVHGLTMKSVSEFIYDTLSYIDYPVCRQEFLVLLEQDETDFRIADDSFINEICDSVIAESIEQVVSISGHSLPLENYD